MVEVIPGGWVAAALLIQDSAEGLCPTPPPPPLSKTRKSTHIGLSREAGLSQGQDGGLPILTLQAPLG